MASRALTAITTAMVALVLALAVPVSQLRSSMVEKSCCCPDPNHCHCPDHDPCKPGQSSIRACHQTQHVVVAPTTPAFTPPAELVAQAAPARTMFTLFTYLAPHAAPPAARPDAPS